MRCAVVLAAGASRRMGVPKMLLPLGDGTVIGIVVEGLRRTAIDRIVVVAGAEAGRIEEALRGGPAEVVVNPRPEDGMLSSARCGLRALPGGCRAALVALGDQPRIPPALVDGMLRALDEGGKGIVVPIHGGRRGHPLLIAAGHFREVLDRHDDRGLRGLLEAHPGDVLEIPWPDEAVLLDMDVPEDYRREREALEREERDPPSPAETGTNR